MYSLVGIDPSFKRTGISILVDKDIYIDRYGDSFDDKSVVSIFNESVLRVCNIIDIIKGHVKGDVKVISECPPPRGSYSPGLYGLDFLLYDSLIPISKEVNVLYPNYLSHVHGTRRYKKSDSLNLSKSIIDVLKNNGYSLHINHRLSHDESEAFIFLFRLMCKEEVLDKYIVGELKTKVNNYAVFNEEKEKLLFKDRRKL